MLDEKRGSLQGKYRVLPDVMVDPVQPALFPRPLPVPSVHSWMETARLAGAALRALDRIARDLKRRPLGLEDLRAAEARWELTAQLILQAADHSRYVETWSEYLLPRAAEMPILDFKKTGFWMEELAAALRPRRFIKRAFLPDSLSPGATIVLPILTDIDDPRFLREVEGALDTYWTRSSWARTRQVRFRIEWRKKEINPALLSGKATLEDHLKTFPPGSIGMTTGGLTHAVHGHVLVLGQKRIQVRSLAHELGHLIGFNDCYLRAISSYGNRGLLGLAVLEWDNPFYPDDLMCDDAFGVLRAEQW